MKVYVPRLDTAPGAHVDDERFHVETKNAALLMAFYMLGAGYHVVWETVVKQANWLDEPVGASGRSLAGSR